MKFIRRFTFLSVLFTSLWAFPQGSFLVELQLLTPNAQIFPIGDFDFARTGLVDPYYIVRIRNTSNEPLDLRLCLEVRYNGEVIAQTESDIVPQVPPTPDPYILTSQAINQNIASINGQPVRFVNTTVDFNAVNDLEQQVLSTGRAPAGTYQVRMFYGDENIGLDCATAALSDPFLQDNVMTITNPTTIEPLFPGQSALASDVEEVGTLFPFFQWQSDIDPASFGFEQIETFKQSGDGPPFYTLQIFEKYPEDETIDDVLSHPPILFLDKFKQNFFQFPVDSDPLLTSGEFVGPVRPLINGNTYYWRVTSVVPTAIGNAELQSDVFRFKVADLAKADHRSSLILQILQQMLGPRYGIVNQELVEKGFAPTGDMNIEGSDVDIAELLQYLNAVIQGKATVKEIEVY